MSQEPPSQATRLAELADLHREGVLNDAEFEAATARVVGVGAAPSVRTSGAGKATPGNMPPMIEPGAQGTPTPETGGTRPSPGTPTNSLGPKPSRRGAMMTALGVVAVLLLGGILIVVARQQGGNSNPSLSSGFTAQTLIGRTFEVPDSALIPTHASPNSVFTIRSDNTWSTALGSSGPWEVDPADPASINLYFHGAPIDGDPYLRANWVGPWMSFTVDGTGTVTACIMSVHECYADVKAPASTPVGPSAVPVSPQEVAEAFFQAWADDDRAAALSLSDQQWVDWLFKHDAAGFTLECSETPYGFGCLLQPGPSSRETVPLQLNVWPNEGAPGYHVADVYEAYPE
jgi:hypothetical protein